MKSKVYAPYIFFTFNFSLFTLIVNGQINLVLNPSFEQYSNTPCDQNTLNYNCTGSTILNWYNPTGSASYWFNSCNNGVEPTGMPSNIYGYQYPHSGDAYASVWVAEGNFRNYITGQFSKSLVAGKKYCINFYISLEDTISWYAVSGMGAFISDTAPCVHSTFGLLTGVPQIENPLNNLLIDKIDWVPISGEYLATGGEQYITIGDFYNDSMSDWTYIGGGGGGFNKVDPEPCYYLDDVSVREINIANARLSKSVGQAFNGSKDTTICLGQSVIIGGDTATPGVTYQWLPTAGLSNPNSPKTLASPNVTTTYTIIVHNDSMRIWNAVGACHCPDTVNEDSVTITVATINNAVCCDTAIFSGQSVVLNAKEGKSYLWLSLATGCDTCASIKVAPIQTTTYSVTITDSLGCSFFNTVTVDVSCPVFIPEAFSPGGGFGSAQPPVPAHNNILYVRSPCISSMDFIVFDRWGNKVFESQNQNNGWDGTYNGLVMNAGTYIWYLKATMLDGINVVKKGNVALVR